MVRVLDGGGNSSLVIALEELILGSRSSCVIETKLRLSDGLKGSGDGIEVPPARKKVKLPVAVPFNVLLTDVLAANGVKFGSPRG